MSSSSPQTIPLRDVVGRSFVGIDVSPNSDYYQMVDEPEDDEGCCKKTGRCACKCFLGSAALGAVSAVTGLTVGAAGATGVTWLIHGRFHLPTLRFALGYAKVIGPATAALYAIPRLPRIVCSGLLNHRLSIASFVGNVIW